MEVIRDKEMVVGIGWVEVVHAKFLVLDLLLIL